MAKANRKARRKSEKQTHLVGNLHCPTCKVPIVCPRCGSFVTAPKGVDK